MCDIQEHFQLWFTEHICVISFFANEVYFCMIIWLFFYFISGKLSMNWNSRDVIEYFFFPTFRDSIQLSMVNNGYGRIRTIMSQECTIVLLSLCIYGIWLQYVLKCHLVIYWSCFQCDFNYKGIICFIKTGIEIRCVYGVSFIFISVCIFFFF